MPTYRVIEVQRVITHQSFEYTVEAANAEEAREAAMSGEYDPSATGEVGDPEYLESGFATVGEVDADSNIVGPENHGADDEALQRLNGTWPAPHPHEGTQRLIEAAAAKLEEQPHEDTTVVPAAHASPAPAPPPATA